MKIFWAEGSGQDVKFLKVWPGVLPVIYKSWNFGKIAKFQIVQITNQECSKNSCVLTVTEIFASENFLGGIVRSECQISESLTWAFTRDLQNRELW